MFVTVLVKSSMTQVINLTYIYIKVATGKEFSFIIIICIRLRK